MTNKDQDVKHNQIFAEGAWRLCMVIVCLCVGLAVTLATAGESEILRIIVGQPTFLHPERMQNAASVAVSRTGVVAAFYPKPPKYCRTSTDGGVTWGPEMDSPPQLGGGAESVALRDGGVL